MAASIAFDIFARDAGASTTLNRVGDAADRSGDRFKRFARVAKYAALGLAGAVGAVGAAGFKLAQGAAEDEQAAMKMAQTFRNAAGATKGQIAATEDWISKMGLAYGVADDDLRPALSRLITATGDVGQAQKLASLAMDVSAGTGKSLESVSTALMKAQNGQVSSLSRLGIKTKDAEGNTLSFKDAVASMSKTFDGQASKSANTAAGQFDRFKLMLSETGESIGYKLLPPLVTAMTWMREKGVPAVREMWSWLKEKLGPTFSQIGDFIRDKVMPAIKQFGDDSPGYIEKIRTAAQPVIDWFKKNWPEISATFKDAAEFIRTTAQRVKQFWDRWGEDIIAVARRAFKVVGDQIMGALKIIRGILRGWTAIMNGDWKGAWEGVKMVWRGLWQSVKAILSAAWDGIRAAASRYLDGFVSFWKKVPGRIKNALGNVGSVLYDKGVAIVQGLIDGAGSLLSRIGEFFLDKVPGWIKGPFKRALGIASPSKVFKGYGRNIMEGLIQGIDGHKMPLKAAMDRVTDAVEKAGDKLKSLLQNSRDFARGFQWGESVFSFQPESGATPTAASMLAFAAQQAQQAKTTRAQVSKLIKLGLSPALIKQLQASGASGQQQIAALSMASVSQIKQLNAYNAMTTSTYGAAGQQAANAVYGDEIRKARRTDEKYEHLLDELRHLSKSMEKGMTAEVKIRGSELIAVIRHKQRQSGVKAEDRVKG